MNILQISTYSFGGAGAAARRLHQGLLGQGIDASFLCLKSQHNGVEALQSVPPFRPAFTQKVIRRAARLIRSGLSHGTGEGQYEMFTSPCCGHRLHQHPLVHSADIIHLHWVAGLVDYPSFFANVKKPIVWTLHDMNPFKGCFHYTEEEQQNIDRVVGLDKRYRDIKRKAYQSAAIKCVTAPSLWLTELSSSSELLGQFPHRHIPNGVDTDIYLAHDRSFARGVFGIPKQGSVLLFVSTDVENRRKGFDLLIEALRPISGQENITLVAVGEKPSNPLPGVFYLGLVQDERLMALAYSAADAFVIPSREDNFPNVMLESLACGTPVIGTPVGGMLEVIRNGENGFLADALSADAIRNAIMMALRSDFDREQIRREALDRFQLPVLADNFTALYRELCQ